MNIGIFGATSHIAQGLIHNFSKNDDQTLYYFERSSYGKNGWLYKVDFDVIINCVGVGTNPKDHTDYFTVTEKYDNLAIDYLLKHPKTLYISFSSGVVHRPLESDYGTVRLYTEAKHRAFKDLNIVDLRLYSYFSRFLNMDDDYFMVDVIKAVIDKKLLETSIGNFVRDFIHPNDLFSLIKKIIKRRKINQVFEVCSRAPVTKQQILDYFSSEHGLKYKVTKFRHWVSATGTKDCYFPDTLRPEVLGYEPKYTSLQTIKEEAKWLLKKDEI